MIVLKAVVMWFTYGVGESSSRVVKLGWSLYSGLSLKSRASSLIFYFLFFQVEFELRGFVTFFELE